MADEIKRRYKDEQGDIDVGIIPHWNEKFNKDKCRTVYWNLIEALEGANQADLSCSVYIRELLGQTKRCDSQCDLSLLRKQYISFMESVDRLESPETEAVDAILAKRDSTARSETIALETVTHYWQWTEECLVGALPWRSWIWYHTGHKVERTFAMIGVISSIFTAGRAIPPMMKSSKKYIDESISKGKNCA